MSLILLFSPDDGLQRDLKSRLREVGPASHTFLHFPGPEDLRTCLDTLGDIQLAFMDLRHLPPPDAPTCPVIGLVEEADQAPPDLPCLGLPLRTLELRSLVHCLTNASASLSPADRYDFQRHLALRRFHSGLAHDLNNRLTTLLGYVIVLLEDVPGEREALEEMRRAAENASGLIRLIQSFHHRGFYPPHEIDGAATLRFLSDLAQRMLGRGLELDLDLPDHPALLRGDEAGLETLALTLLSWCCELRGVIRMRLRARGPDWILELSAPGGLPMPVLERLENDEGAALRDMLAGMDARLEAVDGAIHAVFSAP